MNDQPPQDSLARQFGMFMLVLSSFLGASAAGIGIGWVLWKKAGFPWWILLVTSLLGLYGAVLQVMAYQRKLQAADKK